MEYKHKVVKKVENPYKSRVARKAFMLGLLSEVKKNPYTLFGWGSNKLAHQAYEKGFKSR